MTFKNFYRFNLRKILKKAVFLGLFCVVLILLASVPSSWATGEDSGVYTEGTDKMEIAGDAGFTDTKTTFNPGDTVYIRVTTDRVPNNGGKGNLRLRNYLGGNVGSPVNWTQTSSVSPYVYETQVVLPNPATNYFEVKGLVKDKTKTKTFEFHQVLEINGLDQHFHTFSDPAFTNEVHSFAPGSTVYVKIYGSGGTYSAANTGTGSQALHDFQGNMITSWDAPTDVVQTGNEYTFSLVLPTVGLLDNWWYDLEPSLRDTSGGLIVQIGRMIQIDQTPPETNITDPVSGQVLGGTTKLITGNALNDITIYQVKVAIIRDADNYYWDGSTWSSSPVWNNADITSGQGTPEANWQYSWVLPSSNGGAFTIQAKAIDESSIEDPTPAVVNVTVDNTGLSVGDFNINNDNSYTSTSSVTLYSDVTNAADMRFAESTASLTAEAYIPFQSSYNYSLSPGDGTKTVYAQYRDAGLNETTQTIFDGIILDTTPPQIGNVFPADGAVDIPHETTISVTFNEANSMDASTINGANFYLRKYGGSLVPATVTYDSASKKAILAPSAALVHGVQYTAYLTAGIKDSAGNSLTAMSFSFVTEPQHTVGPFTEGADDKLEIAKDAAFTQLASEFSPGETIFARVTTTRVADNSGGGNTVLNNYDGQGTGVSGSWTQTSAVVPYVYETSLTVPPGTTDYLELAGRVINTAGPRFRFNQVIEIAEVDEHFYTFRDAAYLEETDVFKPGDTVYIKIHGTGATYDAGKTGNGNQILRDLAGNNITTWAAPAVTQTGSTYQFSLTLPGAGLNSDWWYDLNVQLKDTGNQRIVRLGRFILIDVDPPDTTIVDPAGGFLTGASKTVSGTAVDTSAVYGVDVGIVRDADGYWWDGSAWTPASMWLSADITSGAYTSSATWQYVWDLPSSDGGAYTIYARAVDGSNNVDPTPASVTVNVDNTAPTINDFLINNNAAFTNTTTVSLDSSVTGAAEMRFAESLGTLGATSYLPYASSSTYNLSSGDGTKTVYAQYRDSVGNYTVAGSLNSFDSIILDTTAPVVSGVSPPAGSNTATPSTTVTADFDDANGLDDASINTDTFYLKDSADATVTAAITYDAGQKRAVLTPSASLIQGNTYTAYLTSGIRDVAGNSLSSYSWSFIISDITPPDTAISDPIGGTLTGGAKLITGTATDNYDVSTVTVAIQRQSDSLYWDGSSSTWTAGPVWNAATITSGQNSPNASWQYNWSLPADDGGSYSIQARSTDGSGNTDATPAGISVAVDNIAPQPISFKINNDATYTVAAAVTLETSATGAAEMRFAESIAGLTAASYVPYASTYNYNLSGGDGSKTVYVQYRDVVNNETTAGAANTSDSIILDTTAPIVDTVTPPNGSSFAGPSTTVTASFDEANAMDAPTIDSSSFYLTDINNTTITASVSYNATTKTAILTPAAPLTQGMTYTGNLTTAVKDAAGNAMVAPYSWSFTIADSTPPDTVISDPVGGTLTGSSKLITGSASDNVAVQSTAVAISRDSDGYYWDSANSTWTAGVVWNAATITAGQNSPNASWQFNWSLPASDNGQFTIQARATDTGANVDSTPALVTVNVDNVSPIINNFNINDNAVYTTTTTVTLNSDVGGADQMRFAETTASLATESWIPYSVTSSFTLSASDGSKTVYAQYRDAAGNATLAGTSGSTDEIILDSTRPVVVSTFPADGAAGVNVGVVVTATFTEANQMDEATINGATFYLKDPGNNTVPATVTYNAVAKIASLTPTSPLSFETTYTAHVTTAVADAAGNTLASEKVWSFTTTPPSTHPPDAPTNVSVTAGDMVNNISWTAPPLSSDAGGDFDPANNKGGYNIYRSTLSTGPWIKLNAVLTLTTSYGDIDFGVKGYYYYMVRAVDAGGSESADSNVALNRNVSMTKNDSTTGLTTLDAANGLLTLTIPAQGVVTNLSVQTVTTSTPSGVTPLTDVFDLTPNGTTFSPPAVLTFKTPGNPTGAKIRFYDGTSWQEVSGGTYTYDVPNRTVSYNNITHFSYYTVTNDNDVTPPSAPTTLTVSAPADGEIELDWGPAVDPESGISGYIIYRSLAIFDDGNKKSIAQVLATPGNVLTFTDNTGIRGETYYYAVSAENGAGLEGAISNVASETVPGKENAHADYSSNSNLCRDCHTVHGAPEDTIKILRKAPEIENCYVCHDGTGSDFNIKATFKDQAAHDTSMTVQTEGVATKCTECHNPHGVGEVYMTRLQEESMCLKCHNSTSSSINGWNIQEQFLMASRHGVTTETGDGLTGFKVECTSCHGPHGNKRGTGITDIAARLSDPFNTYDLWSGSYNSFCISCHRSSGFPEATATVSTFVPYTIAFPIVTGYPFFPGWDKSAYTGGPAGHSLNYSCQICHAPHGSPNLRLVAYFDGTAYETTAAVAKEENLCYQCHKPGGPSGAKDVQSQFAKASRHPVQTSDIHTDLETSATLGGSNRHAECSDCHDVHKARAGTHAKGENDASNVLAGVKGLAVVNGAAGTTPTFSVTVISYEYQLCFKCHSSYVNLPAGAKDKSVEFNPNNPSYHPVEAVGANSGISSSAFTSGWSSTSKMYCSDCHTTDDAVSTTTPEGPHGSSYNPILKDSFDKYDGNSGGNNLCYECHEYNVYFGDSLGSRFWDDTTTTSEHKTHVGDRKAPCYACHDTHGRSDNAHLIRIKEISETTGTTAFTHDAQGGSCQATCHNNPLANYTYKHKY